MIIKQFEYKPLSHFSYALCSNGEMVVIDPERDPSQYYAFAKAKNAKIVAVIETHPHADFVSGHLQMHRETGAVIYNSKKLGAEYPHRTFDEGDHFTIGSVTLKAMNTPGHSADSITVLAEDESQTVLFTGDTLFIGDVGRPDLRENAGAMKSKRRELAEAMYHTVQQKFNGLPDNAVIYPAHGAGSLCGKSLSDATSGTLGDEHRNNWAFKEQNREKFISTLLDGQPFVPSYFRFNVDLNKAGAENVRRAIATAPFRMNTGAEGLIVDVREEAQFKKGHLKGSINIQITSENSKFETWLGAIVAPHEKFHLVIDMPDDLEKILHRVAKIGYERQLEQVITLSEENLIKSEQLDLADFKRNQENFTIIDVRNTSEVEKGKVFENALSHPLNELRGTAKEIPVARPIVVHCAGGYRSAAGSSIIKRSLPTARVFDLGDEVLKFKA